MNDDQSLADTTTPTPSGAPAGGMFGNPDSTTPPTQTLRMLSFDEVIESARRPRTIAQICLRPDLQAEHSQLVRELAQLINAQGELVVDPESTIGEETAEAVVRAKHQRLDEVAREMRDAMRQVVFEGMVSEEWPTFLKAHAPKNKSDSDVPFYVKLIAKTAVEPTFTEDQVRQMRTKLGQAAWVELADKAWKASTQGGVNAPKSPISLLNLTGRQSETQ